MIHTIFFATDGYIAHELPLSSIRTRLDNNEGFAWVSLEAPQAEETQEVLGNFFHFHPLTIEDCTSTGYQTSKVDDFNHYLFIIAHAIHSEDGISDLETNELNIYLGANYLVTYYQETSSSPVTQLRKQIERDERLSQYGTDFLCHSILDILVDDYMPLLDHFEDEIDQLEDLVLEKPKPATLQRILQLKHTMMTLRRIIAPQREVMNRLSRDEFSQIDQHSRIYFRDIYDHLVRIQDTTESLRDIIAGDLDIYLNATSLRLNEIMKALAVVSTVFLPLSWLAGVYGMNFHFMPELSQTWTYPLVWLAFLSIASGMLLFFKKRGWF